ncbi:MAG: hypothetical protein KJ864_05725 [Candidatus Omnitrophica bacterium]|nr:hypothetical protein [Candidatus Omnitrophota bacterium]
MPGEPKFEMKDNGNAYDGEKKETEAEEQKYSEALKELVDFQIEFGKMKIENREDLKDEPVPDEIYYAIEKKRRQMGIEYDKVVDGLKIDMKQESGWNRLNYEENFLSKFNADERKSLEKQVDEIYSKPLLWHGTGKLRYDSHGESKYQRINYDAEPVEVFKNILLKGLTPAFDPYAERTVGQQRSISLTKRRMIARAISDTMLPEGKKLEFAYGSTLYWHLLSLKDEGLEEFVLGKPGATEQVQLWISDVNKEIKINTGDNVIVMLSQIKSTIKGNFPVIFGIISDRVKTKDLDTLNISNEYEVRATKTVPVEAFSHIEVPWKNVEEVKKMLHELDVDLPVIPIEEGERWMSYNMDNISF